MKRGTDEGEQLLLTVFDQLIVVLLNISISTVVLFTMSTSTVLLHIISISTVLLHTVSAIAL